MNGSTNNPNAAAGNTRLSRLFLVLAAMLLGLLTAWWPGCRKYPPATSAEAYTIMEAVYTACNTKNAGSLNKIEAWIARSKREGKLDDAEQDAFARIIAAARAGRWEEATREAFRFSQDQVGRGKLFDKPELHGKQRAAESGATSNFIGRHGLDRTVGHWSSSSNSYYAIFNYQ